MSLDTKDKLLTGRKFLKMTSRPGYVVETECDEDHVDMTSLTKATVSLSLIVMSANYLKVIIIKLKLPDTVYLFFLAGIDFE